MFASESRARSLPRLRPSWRTCAGAAILLLLVVAVNFNVVFQGQSLIASANALIVDDRSTQLHPGHFGGGNPSVNWHDLGCAWWQWEPAGKMFSRLYRAGRVPLWDPSIGGGADAHIEVTQGQYYPPYILLLLAGDTPALRDAYYLLEIFAAGLFSFLLLRAHGCHVIAAAGMGATYMFSGAVTQNVNSVIGQSICVLPAMVWAVDYSLRRATWRAAAVASLVMAAAALSSFMPVVISGYVLAGIFLLIGLAWPLLESRAGDRRPLASALDWHGIARASSAIVLSVVLIAFLLGPMEAASKDTMFAGIYAATGLQHWSLNDMLSLVSPSVGYDVWQNRDAAARLFEPSGAVAWYVGVVPILLACLGCFRAPAGFRKLQVFFAVALAFVFLKTIGLPPAQWVGYLPFFHNIHFVPYFGGALAFSIAGLAGLGIESLIRSRDKASLGIACLAVTGLSIAILRFAATTPVNTLLTGPALWSVVAHYGLEIARLAMLAVGFLAVLILRATGFQSGKSAAGLMTGLILLDLAPLSLRNRFERADVWVHPPAYVQFLEHDRGVFRVNAIQGLTLTANTSQPFGIDVLSSRFSFASVRYSALLRRYFDASPFSQFQIAADLLPASRTLLDLLNVKYLVAYNPSDAQKKQLIDAGLVPRFEDGHFQVFQNPSVWNRAYLAERVILPPPNQALNNLGALHPGEVLMEQAPPVPLIGDSTPGSIDQLHYDFDRIDMQVHTNHPAMLVLDENYSRGWHARINGGSVPTYRANYSFQAIAVPAGESRVEFRYTPPGLFLGGLLSLLGAALAAAMLYLGAGAPAVRRRVGRPLA